MHSLLKTSKALSLMIFMDIKCVNLATLVMDSITCIILHFASYKILYILMMA